MATPCPTPYAHGQVLLAIETLTYLDEYPVFPNMRKKAKAWLGAGCPSTNDDRRGE
jgi:hypothetical protein